MSDFTPITTQEEFDQRIQHRMARAREKWEKESGISALQAELDQLRAEFGRTAARYKADMMLVDQGIRDAKKRGRILRLVDFEGATADDVGARVDGVRAEFPERFHRPFGRAPDASAPSRTPVQGDGQKQITLDDAKRMSVEEYEANREAVDALLAGLDKQSA